jgi:hypothetical protein
LVMDFLAKICRGMRYVYQAGRGESSGELGVVWFEG